MRIATIVAAVPLFAIAAGAGAQSQVVEQAGPFQHVGTGTLFPETFGDFTRSRIVRYADPAGEDVSVGYDSTVSGKPVSVTEYVYPAPAPTADLSAETLCREEFDGSAAQIDKHDGSRRTGGPAPAPPMSGIAPTLGHRGSFTFNLDLDGTPATLQSQLVLYCYVGGNWFVKYRASALPGADLDGAVTRFIASGPWPGKKF